MIFIMHLMNFYQRFRAVDWFWLDFCPCSERYELAFYVIVLLSNYNVLFWFHYYPSFGFICSNFFLKAINEFPLINIFYTNNFKKVAIIDGPQVSSIKFIKEWLFIRPLTRNFVIAQTQLLCYFRYDFHQDVSFLLTHRKFLNFN